MIIQEAAHEIDHPRAAFGIVAAGAATRSLDHVRSIQGVVEASPTGIGGVQGITRVGDRNHQLWTRDARDFRIHVGGADGKSACSGSR